MDRGDTVDAGRPVGVPGRAGIDGTTAVRGRLAVVHDRRGRHDDAVPRTAGPPAEVDVVAEHRERGVEAAELVPDVATHEHAGAAHREDVADAVVLALVELAPLEPRDPVARAGHGHTDLHQDVLVAPAAQLGADDLGRAHVVGVVQERLERGRGGRGVVVQQPGPAHQLGVGVLGGPGARRERGGDGGTEAGVTSHGDDAVDEAHALGADQEVGGGVQRAGVHGDHAVRPPRGAGEGGQRRREPARAVVGDDDGRDAVAARGELVEVVGEAGIVLVLGDVSAGIGGGHGGAGAGLEQPGHVVGAAGEVRGDLADLVAESS